MGSTLSCVGSNDRGEPAVSYKWTGWVWEMTDWSSRLQENYRSFERNLGNMPNLIKEIWRMSTCNRLDLQTLGLNRLCPKISRITGWFKVDVGWLVNAYSSHSIYYMLGGYSHSIHKVTEVGPQSTKGVATQDARWWFCKQTRWDHGGGHVALRTVISWHFF